MKRTLIAFFFALLGMLTCLGLGLLAYLHPAEEVRITFDMQLRSGLNSVDMFNPYLPTVPPFDHDEIILEVKYNQVLPPYIASLLTYALRDGACRSAISKYVYCRRFEFKDF